MGNREDIKKTIREIVSRVLDIPEEQITDDLELDTDLHIDSLALYEIVVDIEDKYSIRISNDEADDLRTVGEAVTFIEERIKKT